jgi:hypothetical protein
MDVRSTLPEEIPCSFVILNQYVKLWESSKIYMFVKMVYRAYTKEWCGLKSY